MADLDHAIQALRRGDQSTAFEVLRTILAQNPKDATAWLWMSEATADPQRKVQALSRFLALAPDHPRAPSVRLRLQNLQSQHGQDLAPPPVASGASFPPLSTPSPTVATPPPMEESPTLITAPQPTLGDRIKAGQPSSVEVVENMADDRAVLLSPYADPSAAVATPVEVVPASTAPTEPSVREMIPIPPFTPRPAAPPPPDFATPSVANDDDGLPVWVWGLMLLAVLTVIAFIYAIVTFF